MTQAQTTERRAGPTAGDIALRIAVALPGAYAIAWLIAQGGALLLFRGGLTSKADAVLIASNLALLLAPGVVVWAFATRRPLRLATLTGAAAAASLLLAKAG